MNEQNLNDVCYAIHQLTNWNDTQRALDALERVKERLSAAMREPYRPSEPRRTGADLVSGFDCLG